MVSIADPIWRSAHEPVLLLLLRPAGDPGEAEAALRASVRDLQDDALPCELDWVRVPDGVLVQAVECEALEKLLPALAAALDRRGVDGAFELREPPVTAAPPRIAHLLECRMRVRGERERREPRSYRWRADPDAHAVLLGAAEHWCRARGAGAVRSLVSGTVGPLPVEPGEDVLERMLAAVADGVHAQVSAVTADEFRSVAARPWAGGVSLVTGGAWVENGRWDGLLAELTSLLRERAGLLVYGYVRRGWAVEEALLGTRPPFDWPHRPDPQPRASGYTRQSFEDVVAPDAFGAQLLGPGYAGRVPGGAAWRSEPVAGRTVLLEHRDPAAWFGAPFVPFGRRLPDRERRPPPVLAQARAGLEPILYAPGALGRLGVVDASEDL